MRNTEDTNDKCVYVIVQRKTFERSNTVTYPPLVYASKKKAMRDFRDICNAYVRDYDGDAIVHATDTSFEIYNNECTREEDYFTANLYHCVLIP